jgi:hypothetical protein
MPQHYPAWVSSRGFLFLLATTCLVLSLSVTARAQSPDPGAPVPPGSTFTILDLRFRTEPLAGEVKALQVTETPTEIRILMPADVLFDFDKADVRPDAAKVLSQAADMIRSQGKRGVLIEGHRVILSPCGSRLILFVHGVGSSAMEIRHSPLVQYPLYWAHSF